MFKSLLFKRLPHYPIFLPIKVLLGVFVLSFLLGYQPTFTQFPPVKKSIVKAQSEQSNQITPSKIDISFQLPHPGYITTHFSASHPGIDLCTGLGMPIKAIAKGTVVDLGYNFWGLGLIVVVDHGQGYKSLYGHMGKIFAKKGDEVTTDSILGEVGLTGNTSGPHTHLEISKDGTNIDPLPLLPAPRDYPKEEDFKFYGSAAQALSFATSSATLKK